MKKTLLGFALFVVIGISIFVSAWAGESGTRIYRGWNLVYGFISPDQLDGQGFESSHIKAIYAFIPTTQKYVRLYPNGVNLEDLEDKGIIDDDEVLQMAVWVYSDKTADGTLNGIDNSIEYWLYANPSPIDGRRLYKGWNFLAITPDIAGNSLNDVKGSCNFERGHGWNAQTQQWGANVNFDEKLTRDKLSLAPGMGIVIKVSSNCVMGFNGNNGDITLPPQIPSDNNPSRNLILESDFGGLKFNTRLGEDYIRREYRSFPLEQMIKGDAAKYGSGVGVNAIIIESSGNKELFLNKVLQVYKNNNFTSELLTPPASIGLYKLNYIPDTSNEVALWMSSNYLIIVHGKNLLIDGSDEEDIVEAYANKYPPSYSCTDSDGGKNYYIKGDTGIASIDIDNDFCVVDQVSGKTCYASGFSQKCMVEECNSSDGNCYVAELFCPSTNANDIDVELYSCLKGCKKGACIQ